MSQPCVPASWIFRSIACVALLLTSVMLFSSAFARQDATGKEISDAISQSKTEEGALPKTPLEDPEKISSTATKGSRLIASFTVFLLAVFVGVEVINKVPPTLHTPLMSGSNAISGITIIGSLLAAGNAAGGFGAFLGSVAVILAMINVAGGFLVTHRMLMMFKKKR